MADVVDNVELDLAWQYVTETNKLVFVTGKAGTGKTTFLHKLKNNTLKRTVVVAPTGVAAINAKGVTIHSFFQLPFGPIVPNNHNQSSHSFNRKFGKTKINIIKSMDLLIIDEISMVRADLLDGIDATLRRFRNKQKIFGGVQVVMIGDLQQLAPVMKEQEWEVLKTYYRNGYFFSSRAYQEANPVVIELKHIYRQKDPNFIKVLNEIRTNTLSEESASILNKRYKPDFVPATNDGFIQLATHNKLAKLTNSKELDSLNGEEHIYNAEITGKFPEHAYPNALALRLKVGAQVMFIKNDSATDKRFFNGKIGKVMALDESEVVVRCPDDDFNIITKAETWDNITYSVNKETKAIEETKLGSFTQIPLRLAWAITIHKSQGLTFEKAIIDVEGAFAHGQTYVALSRCKSLAGLVLKSKITPNQIINDSQVVDFNESAYKNQPDADTLMAAQREFQLDLISEIFNFYHFLYPVNRILDAYYKHKASIAGNLEAPMGEIKERVTNLLKVSNRFSLQLRQDFDAATLPEVNSKLQERFVKGIAYYKTELDSFIKPAVTAFNFTTDNKTIETELLKHLHSLELLLEIKYIYFGGLSNGFKTKTYLDLRAKAVFMKAEKPKKLKAMVVDGTINVELFELLRVLRNDIAQDNDLVHYQIFTQKALYAICETLPTSKQALLAIPGMGKVRVEKYGAAILEVVREFCRENDISFSDKQTTDDLEHSATLKKEKIDTKTQSLNLYKSGKTIAEIAAIRALNENTIFGHLASFISAGLVKPTDLISETHLKELQELIPKHPFENLSDLKHQLDDKFSYGEIRLVLELLQ
ncbi:helix-turn-helix domain-containing protein [Bizionia sediminis]|uniref:Helix-turn-helix domain-containing protein n=1 Tax=Bizionia sediminis TaxID=1737064 RepID=A0ABW5KMF3_9FLAO